MVFLALGKIPVPWERDLQRELETYQTSTGFSREGKGSKFFMI